ncbi:MAG: hypothetical protein ACTHLK_22450, partial [Brucella intermedia]
VSTGTNDDQTVKAQESSFPARATSFPNAEQNVVHKLALEEAARVAEAFRNNDWIAHDIRTGAFPKQSEPGVAIAAAIRALSSPDHADAELCNAVHDANRLVLPKKHKTEKIEALLRSLADEISGHKPSPAATNEYASGYADGRYDAWLVVQGAADDTQAPDHADAGKVEGDGSAAALDVLAERRRQIEAEWWTPEHDNQFVDRELAKAAACYAIDNAAMWPWSMSWWKPSNSRRNLVKAGALILAEIERLDRAVSRVPAPQLRPGKKRLPKVPEKRTAHPSGGDRHGE